MKGTFWLVAVAALALSLAATPTLAQDGRIAYCGPSTNGTTCGPANAPGRANSCSNSGCHTQNPLNDAQGRAMKGAGSLGAIQGSPDAGMQAIISLYSMQELQAIADWLLSLTQAGAAPACNVTASNPTPNTGTSITLTATCTNAPTAYAWSGCTSTTSTCTTTSTAAGTRTYTVTATNASGQGSASANVTWITPGTTPPPPPPPPAPTPTPTPTPTPPPPTTGVVEYFHAGFGHYFITAAAPEIDALDSGRFAGWSRTGRTFKAYTASNGDQRLVCRFFTVAFAPKSSHFYTANSQECQDVRANNRDWQYEGEAFFVQPADTLIGACPTGTEAVYRLYNDGQSGAPNHRYTTLPSVRDEMVGRGWTLEGVAFCAPM